MKKNYTSRNTKNQKVRKAHVTMPFEGKIRQLQREKVVLCEMVQFSAFKQALNDAHVEYELGDFYKDGIIVVKK